MGEAARRIGIIGGGASGMAAAIAAARAGCAVTLLERQEEIGKKLLGTGNGRCNLSNLDFDVKRDYRGGAVSRLEAFFDAFGVRDTVRFFESCGLVLTERNGYLYPRSMQAASVREALGAELERLRVRTVCGCGIRRIETAPGFRVLAEKEAFSFDRLILACGTRAGLPEKNAADGFELARSVGLRTAPLLPALGALRCEETFFRPLAGVRCTAQVELAIRRGDRLETRRESGELQLTDYGISGIPVFQCSRYAAAGLHDGARVTASLDFLPEYEAGPWEALCRRQYRVCLGKRAETLACGLVARKLALVLLRLSGLSPEDTVGEGTRGRIFSLFALMRHLPVTIVSVNPVSKSQVCAGGIVLDEVTDRLEAKRIPGLFLCGEMLDVDGRCGGYNLQWAWTSGVIAGRHAAEEGGA